MVCPDSDCGQRYPVVGGLPVLLPDPGRFCAENYAYLTARDDVPAEVGDVLAGFLGAGSFLDVTRQHLSTYGRDHFGRFDPADDQVPPAGSVLALLDAALAATGDALDPLPAGPVIDLGCAVGATSMALAARLGRAVLGVDLHVPLLRCAHGAVRDGVAHYPRRRMGMQYDWRWVPLPWDRAVRAQVGFWLGDALMPPIADGSAALITALNLLDCVARPADLLARIGDLLTPGGIALLATPYDWSSGATPPAHWLDGGDALRAMIAADDRLVLSGECADHEWRLRLHDRSFMQYSVHIVVIKRVDAAVHY